MFDVPATRHLLAGVRKQVEERHEVSVMLIADIHQPIHSIHTRRKYYKQLDLSYFPAVFIYNVPAPNRWRH